MSTITIPKKLAQKDAKEFTPTATHKKALAKAESNLKQGKTLSYNGLVQKLGFGN